MQNTFTPKRLPLAAMTVAMGLGAMAGSSYALEAGMYGTTDWTTTCNANDLSFWDNMVDEWYNEIDNHGWYTHDRRWVDGSISNRPMCDPDKGSGCQDGTYMDEQDAAMIFGHGADLGDHWGMVVRNQGAGNSCWIEQPGAGDIANAMYAGDYDLEFLAISSCFSMDDDNMPFTWHTFRDPVDTPVNGRRLHQLDGFHGIMWIGGCCDDQYGDFAEDAHWMSMKSAWMSNMYVTGINGSATQCPVAYAVGANRTDCLLRLSFERYNLVFSDPSAIGYYCYSYYPGCDPSGEDPFTP